MHAYVLLLPKHFTFWWLTPLKDDNAKIKGDDDENNMLKRRSVQWSWIIRLPEFIVCLNLLNFHIMNGTTIKQFKLSWGNCKRCKKVQWLISLISEKLGFLQTLILVNGEVPRAPFVSFRLLGICNWWHSIWISYA